MAEQNNSASNSFQILLAEDDLEMRKMLSWALSRKGYAVTDCPDGTALMKKLGLLETDINRDMFDLIISDIRMPGLNGFQVMEAAGASMNLPPVILITAFPDEKAYQLAGRLGAAALFAKPFNIEDLLAEVHRILPLDIFQAAQPKLPRHKEKAAFGFPMDISFPHHFGSEPVKAYIYDMAEELASLKKHIKHVRVTVDEYNPEQHKKHHYCIKIHIATLGKPIIVTHDTDKRASFENLYLGIHTAFDAALRKLKQYVVKRKRRKRHHFNPNISLDVDNDNH